MIIIGNKPYYTIKLNNIIDTFDENIRCNFSLPNNNNGPPAKFPSHLNERAESPEVVPRT